VGFELTDETGEAALFEHGDGFAAFVDNRAGIPRMPRPKIENASREGLAFADPVRTPEWPHA